MTRVRIAALICLLLAWPFIVAGSTELNVVHVGGDVPKPGPLKIATERIPTVDGALREMGFDLTPFYQKETQLQGGPPCPIQVQFSRNSQPARMLIPSVDEKALKTERVQRGDTLVVRDFRKYPEKIEAQRKRIEDALKEGSAHIREAILAAAVLRSEYHCWLFNDPRLGTAKQTAIKEEVSLLCREGKGSKVVELLEFDRGALMSSGIPRTHPALLDTQELKRMFAEELVNRAD